MFVWEVSDVKVSDGNVSDGKVSDGKVSVGKVSDGFEDSNCRLSPSMAFVLWIADALCSWLCQQQQIVSQQSVEAIRNNSSTYP